mgnify:CR=1 FL=1
MHIDSGKSKQPCGQPKRYKQVLLTFVGLLAPVYFVPPAMSSAIAGPRLLTVSAVVAAIVVLMTYVIMPVLNYLTASWLCEPVNRRSQGFMQDIETAAIIGGKNHE